MPCPIMPKSEGRLLRSFRVERSQELELALHEAFLLDEPVFIDAVVESIADRLPPVLSWLKAMESTLPPWVRKPLLKR